MDGKRDKKFFRAMASGALVAVAVVLAPAAGGGAVFHSGTTGSCDGCHGKQVATPENPNPAVSGSMLRGSDPSSTCLICHEAPVAGLKEQHHVATPSAVMGAGVPPQQLTPGGDFGWLKKNYRWTDTERVGSRFEQSSPGERHGHNIIAADYNYVVDGTHPRAPGGTYPSSALSCISCHDPHGTYRRFPDGSIGTQGTSAVVSGSYPNATASPSEQQPVGVYRMLAGRGYQPKYDPSVPPLTADAPAAVAPSNYNRSESTGSTRVAYGSGMSEWCQNCHTSIHGGAGFGHSAGNGAKLGARIIANYNAYVASGNLNGSQVSSYSSLVPYEMGTDDYSVLRSTAGSVAGSAAGPDPGAGSPNVMCLTCHRAHASGWDSMTRWNTGATFIVVNGRYPGVDTYESAESAQGRTSVETRKAYYDRQPDAFALYQRSLCNKCHVRD